MILCHYVAIGTFHSMKEGVCTFIFANGLCIYIAIDCVCIYRGGWDTEGVTVMSTDPINSIIRCNSTHLTSFAVLVDVSGGQDVRSNAVMHIVL